MYRAYRRATAWSTVSLTPANTMPSPLSLYFTSHKLGGVPPPSPRVISPWPCPRPPIVVWPASPPCWNLFLRPQPRREHPCKLWTGLRYPPGVCWASWGPMVRKGRGRKATSVLQVRSPLPSSLGLGDKLPPPDHLSIRARPRRFHLTARVFPSLVSPVGDSLGLGRKLSGYAPASPFPLRESSFQVAPSPPEGESGRAGKKITDPCAQRPRLDLGAGHPGADGSRGSPARPPRSGISTHTCT